MTLLTNIGPPSEPLAGQTSVTFAAPLLPASVVIALQYTIYSVPDGNFTAANFNSSLFSTGGSMPVTSTASKVVVDNLVPDTIYAFRYEASASAFSTIVFVATLPGLIFISKGDILYLQPLLMQLDLNSRQILLLCLVRVHPQL